jgi:hypothetical protein
MMMTDKKIRTNELRVKHGREVALAAGQDGLHQATAFPRRVQAIDRGRRADASPSASISCAGQASGAWLFSSSPSAGIKIFAVFG